MGKDLMEKTIPLRKNTYHVANRRGTSFRKLSKQVATEVTGEDRKRKGSLGSRNILTDNAIDQLTRYFGMSIRRKRGTSAKTRDDFLASYFHCSSPDENPRTTCARPPRLHGASTIKPIEPLQMKKSQKAIGQ